MGLMLIITKNKARIRRKKGKEHEMVREEWGEMKVMRKWEWQRERNKKGGNRIGETKGEREKNEQIILEINNKKKAKQRRK